MKVLFTFGGIPHYLDALLERLHRKGVEVVVVVPEKGNGTIGKGVKMVQGGTYKHLYAQEKRMFYGKNAYPSLPDLVKEECPDLVVLGWPYFLQVFFQPALRKAMRICGARLVIREIPFQTPPYGNIREYFSEHPMYDEQMRLLSVGTGFYLRQWITALLRKYCYADAVGTLNYSTMAYNILPSYGVEREQIHVTYNSTDTETLLREKALVQASGSLLPKVGKRVLHIGRLVKWKRVDLLIDAFARIAGEYDDAELVIVGDGPELENLKRQAVDASLTVLDESRNATKEVVQKAETEREAVPEQKTEAQVNHNSGIVRFIGAVYDPKELGAYMNESTVYVLAGMGGLSINDAMSYGMPIICSVCDSTERDLVVDGKNGFIFREGDVYSLVDKLEYLFDHPQRCEEMGVESERIIREKINIETVSNRYIRAFEDLMKR
ncbi:MAG: glycosyltransferase [Bacteroides sp.]|jgi:glycosyltransferase involved in cell wall biosynthesis|nr:glycosyltransferase [Bacteroides sp.]